jgi:hypothetical protein
MAKAKQLYVRAKDQDREFARSRSQWNDIVRAVRSPNVHVLDLETILAGYSEHGMPGFDLFHDHCHLKLRGNSIVAFEIAKELAREMDVSRELIFREEAESIGISPWELRKLYLAKNLKWLKLYYYSGLSEAMGANAGEVAQRYRDEEESLSALKHKISAATDLESAAD